MMKSSLRSDEIAAAVGGFHFICEADFIGVSRFHPCGSKDFIKRILIQRRIFFHYSVNKKLPQKLPHY